MAEVELTLTDLQTLVKSRIIAAVGLKVVGYSNTHNSIHTALEKLSASNTERAVSEKAMVMNLMTHISSYHKGKSEMHGKKKACPRQRKPKASLDRVGAFF